MSILLNTLCERVQKEFELDEPKWLVSEITQDDIDFLNKECNNKSEFDETNKRKTMYENMMKGVVFVSKLKCEYGELFTIFETLDQMADLPWGLWGRILRMFSEKGKKPFKVFLLADKSLRKFPSKGEPITPENINGGYTYRCNRETIVIYRAEDATRVLIHELQHSCCLDNVVQSIDIIEAETEAWAELFYVAIISQGKWYMFKDLVQRQSEWMRKQDKKVKKHMKDPESREFPWRYTIGKEDVWKRWGILREEDLKPSIKVGDSLRLTYPPNEILKQRFKVNVTSTIL
jgi:hypothetical protein